MQPKAAAAAAFSFKGLHVALVVVLAHALGLPLVAGVVVRFSALCRWRRTELSRRPPCRRRPCAWRAFRRALELGDVGIKVNALLLKGLHARLLRGLVHLGAIGLDVVAVLMMASRSALTPSACLIRSASPASTSARLAFRSASVFLKPACSALMAAASAWLASCMAKQVRSSSRVNSLALGLAGAAEPLRQRVQAQALPLAAAGLASALAWPGLCLGRNGKGQEQRDREQGAFHGGWGGSGAFVKPKRDQDDATG